jgi:hypothetical protein
MREMCLSQHPIGGAKGLCMWKCPKCGLLASSFSSNGKCLRCQEGVDFKTWEMYFLYDLPPSQPEIGGDNK